MLFDRRLGIAKNQVDLEELLKQYPPPEYDPLYVCLATRVDFEEKRQWIEAKWKEYQQFADKDFASEFKKHLRQRAWELSLGITLHKRWTLQPEFKSKHKGAGPDFKTLCNVSEVAQTVWIEAIAVEKGKSINKVPEMVLNGVACLPEDKMLLRLTNGLDEKYRKYVKYVENNVVGTDDPYVIAINRSELEHLDPQLPLILKCLFRLEHQVLFVGSGRLLNDTERFWTIRDQIMKNGSPISMGFFDDPKYSGISAVIYVVTDIINSPLLSEEMGDNFTIILNPHAKNPLPEELLTFGKIWRKEGDQIILKKV